MKIKVFLLVILSSITTQILGQDQHRKHSIGVYQNFTDYNVELLDGNVIAFDSAISTFTRVAYQRRWSRNWMLNTGITNGFIFNQNVKEKFIDKAYVIGGDVSVMLKMNNGKLIKEDARVGPYLTFGYRLDYISKLNDLIETPWVMANQYGAGLTIRLTERTHLQVQTAIDQKLLADFNTHMQYRFGLTQSIGKFQDNRRDKLLDSDFDGIVDVKDNCPGLFGLASLNGCPDTSFISRKLVIDSLEESLLAKQIEVIQLRDKLDRKDSNSGVRVDTVLVENETIIEKIDTVYLSNEKTVERIDTVFKTIPGATLIDTIYLTDDKIVKSSDTVVVIKDRIVERIDTVEVTKEVFVERIDTVYKTLIVKSDSSEAERLRLKAEKDELERRLALEKAAKEADRLAREKADRERIEREKAETDRIARERARKLAEEEAERIAEEERRKANPQIPQDKNYYVITMSSPNLTTAQNWLNKMVIDFPNARILPQPNGYYRVGVFVGKNKEKGLEILEQVKLVGYNPSWLSVE